MIRRVVRKARSLLGRPRRLAQSLASGLSQILPTISIIITTLTRSALSRRTGSIRVGVDVRPFYEPLTGVGWYLFHLLEELARDERLELVAFGEPLLSDLGPHFHVSLPATMKLQAFDFRGRKPSRLAARMSRLAFPILIALQRCDLLFGANYFLPRAMSSVARRRVVTVHDLTYRKFPELLQKETLENLNRSMLREMLLADAVICVSEATRRDLLESYPFDPRRVVTIHSGLASPPAKSEKVDALPERYLLFVSTIEPRKNVRTLLLAFEQLLDEGRYDGDLVLVGKIGWKSEDVVAAIAASRWRGRIHHLDYLRREQLSYVYGKAEVFVFPSLYEGFGFPLLEAMAQGVPTIAARCSSLPEVGGDAALYFEPTDSLELKQRIGELIESPALRAELIARGQLRAASFRWSDAARATADVFIRTAGRGL